jgi:hypothetical protein
MPLRTGMALQSPVERALQVYAWRSLTRLSGRSWLAAPACCAIGRTAVPVPRIRDHQASRVLQVANWQCHWAPRATGRGSARASGLWPAFEPTVTGTRRRGLEAGRYRGGSLGPLRVAELTGRLTLRVEPQAGSVSTSRRRLVRPPAIGADWGPGIVVTGRLGPINWECRSYTVPT